MSKVSIKFPALVIRDKGIQPSVQQALRMLMRNLDKLRIEFGKVINNNAVEFVSQAAQPTVTSGQITCWHDSDATSGNPTHYLVVNHSGTTVTFASEELVP